MQEKHQFEYAVIRIVPRVEREEFLNVGVIIYSASEKYLGCMFKIDERKLLAFAKEPDIEEYKQRLLAFEYICAGSDNSGEIGKLPISSRFRWLTSRRSTVIQISPVHPGLCMNAKETLLHLYTQLVV